MSGIFHDASKDQRSLLVFEASHLRVNTACSQKRFKRPSQKMDGLRVGRPDLEVVHDRIRDGHEGALVLSRHL